MCGHNPYPTYDHATIMVDYRFKVSDGTTTVRLLTADKIGNTDATLIADADGVVSILFDGDLDTLRPLIVKGFTTDAVVLSDDWLRAYYFGYLDKVNVPTSRSI